MCKIAQASPGSSQLLFIQSSIFEMNDILCPLMLRLTVRFGSFSLMLQSQEVASSCTEAPLLSPRLTFMY